jgi:hypothetical protein
VVWALTAVGTFGVGLIWLLAMKASETVFQECAVSAAAAAVLIGVYIVARAATEILGHVGALRA